MIAKAFESVEFPILPVIKQHEETGIELIKVNPKLFTPSDFDYSPFFEIIKYPFIELSDRGNYRDLPWNRNGLISPDGQEIVDEALTKPAPTVEADLSCDDDEALPIDKVNSEETQKFETLLTQEKDAASIVNAKKPPKQNAATLSLSSATENISERTPNSRSILERLNPHEKNLLNIMTKFDPLESLNKNFTLKIADNDDLKLQEYHFRYHIFCKEFKFESEEHCHNQLEKDIYDESATHLQIYQNNTSTLVGSIRLAQPGDASNQLILPFENYTEADFLPAQDPAIKKYAEASRFSGTSRL